MDPHAPIPARDPRGERRIGFFGGSFDPIHVGHLHAARAARDLWDLDRVVFVPAQRSPFKPGRVPAPAADRLAMVRLAIAGERGFEASDLELTRAGPSYTIDSVRALPRRLGEPEDARIVLIVGSDNLPGIAHWREARALLERVDPVVIHRAGEPDAGLAEVERELGPALAGKLSRGYLRLPPVLASSTDVRAALAGGEGASWLPAPVADYIRAHGLYGAAS
ncbi:MAG: nicotinate (nicotinamide) nucleotide adenylyltransferase [Planctomycetes bacterium]|nr:nicotinate (nicotinamide) nucleotide adenylyltransferase [Planctomycetota bacterium]